MAREPMSEEGKQKLVARLVAGKEAKRRRALEPLKKQAIEVFYPGLPAELGASTEGLVEVMPPELQAAIDATDRTPQLRAQMVRRSFGARGWPNKEHPGTVRDFLNEHKIPIIG